MIKKLKYIAFILALILLAAGVFDITYRKKWLESVPDEAVYFDEQPVDVKFGEETLSVGSIVYNDRKYVFYGKQKRRLFIWEIGTCFGYSPEKTDQYRDQFFTLTDSTDYIGCYLIGGPIAEFDFFRAVDTVGMDIDTPHTLSLRNSLKAYGKIE